MDDPAPNCIVPTSVNEEPDLISMICSPLFEKPVPSSMLPDGAKMEDLVALPQHHPMSIHRMVYFQHPPLMYMHIWVVEWKVKRHLLIPCIRLISF